MGKRGTPWTLEHREHASRIIHTRPGETALAARTVTSVGGRHPTVPLSNPEEAPRADPHAGCCGGWGLTTPGYPI